MAFTCDLCGRSFDEPGVSLEEGGRTFCAACSTDPRAKRAARDEREET